MTMTPPRLLTAEEFFCLPDDGRRYELVEGRLEERWEERRRGPALLLRTCRHTASWACLFAKSTSLASWAAPIGASCSPHRTRSVTPDVCFVRADRLPGGRVPVRSRTGAPDLVVEVLSPSDLSPHPAEGARIPGGRRRLCG
ncbi:MAG: Uma2 family endonuclease [Dehalococcoidia bacterium]